MAHPRAYVNYPDYTNFTDPEVQTDIIVNFKVIKDDNVMLKTPANEVITQTTIPLVYNESKLSRQSKVRQKIRDLFGNQNIIVNFEEGLLGGLL